MTKDRTPQRTVDMDDEEWTPFHGPVHGTSVPERTVDADTRPSTLHADAAGWRPRVIEGGRGHQDAPVRGPAPTDVDAASDPLEDDPSVDVLDAAAADALAIFTPAAPARVQPVSDPSPVPPVPSAAPGPRPPAATALQVPPATPEPAPQTAPEAAPEADSTPHTPHPAPAGPETPAPAQSPSQAAETPHSTPWLRTAVGWLNPYDILDQPLPPISAIYEAAATTVTDRSGFDRVTEIGWVYAIGMPVTVACYTLAAAVQHKARGIGVGLTVLAWVLAADAAPVDASVIWWWTALGYWVSTVFILPAVIQAKK